MNREIIEGKWEQAKGAIKQKWADLTDDDLKHMEGSHDKVVGRLREKFGWTAEQAERELTDLFKSKS